MGRTACAWLPRFELNARLQAQPDLVGQPLLIADASSTRAEVIDASDEACAEGVAAGMSMITARALCPDALIVPPDPALMRAVSERVLRVLYRFAPVVGRDGNGAFFIDLEGTELLHPDEVALSVAIEAALLEDLSLPCCVAIADEPITAWIVARTTVLSAPAPAPSPSAPVPGRPRRVAEPVVVERGGDARHLAALPVRALPMPDEIGQLCRVLGLETVADLQRLPAGALSRRFGRVGDELAQRARGRANDVYRVEIPADPESVELPLDDPTDDYEVLLFLHKSVLDRLLRQVAARRRAVAALELTLALSDSDRSKVTHVFRPARATLASRTLLELVRLWLERAELEAMVETIRMTAKEVAVAEARQLSLFSQRSVLDDDALALALARLVAAFGKDSVVQPTLVSTYRPERRLRWRPLGEGEGEGRASSSGAAGVGEREGAVVPPVLCLLEPPQPVRFDVVRGRITPRLEDATAHGERGGRAGGAVGATTWRVVELVGPFHLEGEWWDTGFRRRYVLARTDTGEVCCLYQQAALAHSGEVGGWFLQAYLD